jgi:CheY-like chemotaxis protein
MTQQITQEIFTRAVHRALHHIYDPVELRLNPLSNWLNLTRGDTASALRSVLLNAISSLKPGPRVAEDSNAWRVYQVLCYRFEEQSSQEDVAAQMTISSRQVRRLEQTAIRALAASIAAQYNLQIAATETETPARPAAAINTPRAEHEQELDWLRKSNPHDYADVAQLVETALKTGEPLLARAEGTTIVRLTPALPPVRGQTTTLRQIVLNLLLAAVGAASRPVVTIESSYAHDRINLTFSTASSSENVPAASQLDHTEFLSLAQQLAQVSGGSVEQVDPPGNQAFMVRLSLVAVERIPVLFVDDNLDSLRLFERSLTGTRFHFTGTRDPLDALRLAGDIGARIIILDIMLPGIDGWEILGRLREHPLLGSIPVIISTILPHEQLAISLGATGFLRKPVVREALIDLLDRLVA